MKCIEFEGQTTLLRPPGDMERGSCGALPVYRFTYSDGSPAMISVWKPSDAEIEALKNGAHIALTVLGGVHPPIAMHVQKYTEMP